MDKHVEHLAVQYNAAIRGGAVSYSGTGSSLAATVRIRKILPGLLRRLGVGTVLDVGCGDHVWLAETALPCQYLGADAVAAVVAANSRRYQFRRFLQLDGTVDPLPAADLILCRDCLVHLGLIGIRRALANFAASPARWLLTTTFPKHGPNADLGPGGWQPLNLQADPLNLPPPADLLNEGWPEAAYADKSLGLWDLADQQLRKVIDGLAGAA